MTTPDYGTVLDDIEAACVAICDVITPDKNASEYALYTQGEFPYWTISFPDTAADKPDSGLYDLIETVILTCYVGDLTEFESAEASARTIKRNAVETFMQRPFLQSEGTYARGVVGIAPEGVTMRRAALTRTGPDGQQRLSVSITLNVPIALQVDAINF